MKGLSSDDVFEETFGARAVAPTSSRGGLVLAYLAWGLTKGVLLKSRLERGKEDSRLRAGWHWEGTTTADDAQGTSTQSHISPSILVYEEERGCVLEICYEPFGS